MRAKLKMWLDKGILTRCYIREAEEYELDTLSAEMVSACEITGKEPETLFVMAEAEMKGYKAPYLICALWRVIEKLGFDRNKLQIPMLPFDKEKHLTKKEEPVTLTRRVLPKREPVYVPAIEF